LGELSALLDFQIFETPICFRCVSVGPIVRCRGPASLFSAALLIDVAETGPGYMRYDPLMPHSGRMIGISGPRDYSRRASAGGGMMCRIDAALHTEMYL